MRPRTETERKRASRPVRGQGPDASPPDRRNSPAERIRELPGFPGGTTLGAGRGHESQPLKKRQ
ncbi:Hypothetical Protein RSKD131_0534 [Cereibacter sphaeroides KD131]|nr:Hypothetical Protein RSKD131_0534 [Cereibacter sphaeroides KD131]